MSTSRGANREWYHRGFRAGIWLKGLNGATELVGGLLLLIGGRPAILDIVLRLTQQEILEDPRDPVANLLVHAAAGLSIETARFAAFYLMVHGAIKVGLVAGLLRRRRRAFPIALVALGAMVAYQLFRWWLTRSLPLGLLSAFDLIILWLIWAEWYHLRRATGADASSVAGSGSRPT